MKSPIREWHWYAELYPMMPDDALQDLEADIKVNGQRMPIITQNGLGLDGRNRDVVLDKLGIKPKTEELPPDQDPIAYIISANSHRRMLTKGQIAMSIAFKNPELTPRGGGADRPKSKAKAMSRDKTLPSTSRIQFAQQVLRYSRPLAESVFKGTITLDAALEQIQKAEQDTNSAEAQLARLKAEAPELAARVADENLTLQEAMDIHTQNLARIERLKENARLAAGEMKAFVQQVEMIEAGIKVGAEIKFKAGELARIDESYKTFVALTKNADTKKKK